MNPPNPDSVSSLSSAIVNTVPMDHEESSTKECHISCKLAMSEASLRGVIRNVGETGVNMDTGHIRQRP